MLVHPLRSVSPGHRWLRTSRPLPSRNAPTSIMRALSLSAPVCTPLGAPPSAPTGCRRGLLRPPAAPSRLVALGAPPGRRLGDPAPPAASGVPGAARCRLPVSSWLVAQFPAPPAGLVQPPERRRRRTVRGGCSRSSPRPWRCTSGVGSGATPGVSPRALHGGFFRRGGPGPCKALRGHTRIVPFRPVPVCGRTLAVPHFPRRTVDQREGVGRKCSPQRNVRGPRVPIRTNPYAHFRGDASGAPPTPRTKGTHTRGARNCANNHDETGRRQRTASGRTSPTGARGTAPQATTRPADGSAQRGAPRSPNTPPAGG
ncbi:hypothetical protein SAMN05216267_10307 [Actinacidiphila rubida]|uniref:Uncharacterized protein n=1 Tax=Actinacidiphila rubida TaxID=310780 RepID=A0A1H8QIP9_9ACTN|nr:hypothetical protein SAMN05216267_10307 [Actinacidiphila rubida]